MARFTVSDMDTALALTKQAVLLGYSLSYRTFERTQYKWRIGKIVNKYQSEMVAHFTTLDEVRFYLRGLEEGKKP